MNFPPTLVCVHAHPDDESLFTAGISAHYGSLGYDVVLVTCTNGRLGFDDQGRPGSHAAHDVEVTASARAGELQRAAKLVGFNRIVTLGYNDSGMVGWRQNSEDGAFMNVDVEKAGRTLAALLDEVSATVVVTYDENGFYGHPDHIMANRLTRRAIELSASVQRLYYPVVPSSVLERFTLDATEQAVFLPAWVVDAVPGTPDELVSTVMDVRAHARRKQEGIAAHASQVDNADLVTMAPELFTLLFGVEYYQRAWSRDAASGDDTDLFGGL
jgi:LmbE family N-acetylglucosaminyl deacetylase